MLFICGFLVFGASSITLSVLFHKYRKKKASDRDYMRTDLQGAPLRFIDAPVAISDLSPGDHIYVAIRRAKSISKSVLTASRSISAIGYHHGVYLGSINGEHRVTDFGREQKTHPVITSLNAFMYENPTNQLYLRRYTSGNILPVENILEQAAEMEGNMEWGRYRLWEKNCEHFATFLKTGKQWSMQAYVGY